MPRSVNQQRITTLIFWLYVLFILSLFCSFRALTSISVGFILALGLAKNKLDSGRWFGRKKINLLFFSCVLFYLIQVAGLLYTHDQAETLKHLQTKSALVFIPFGLCFNTYLSSDFRQRLMKYYCIILSGVVAYCLVHASIVYQASADGSVFLYHKLVSPVLAHAIQFSILVFIGIVFLLECIHKRIYSFRRWISYLLIAYFSIFLVLLSSKLVIVYSIIYALFYFLRAAREKKVYRMQILVSLILCIAGGGLLLLTDNPVSKRFYDIVTGDIGVIREKSFHPGNYFNGLQFRLLQWRFVREILTDNNAWMMGVSAGDAKKAIDEKYIETNMYIGDPSRNDHGFLGYNTHNQFLESVLQSGIPGLLAFFLICTAMVVMMIRKKDIELTTITILVLAYSLNESVFETQYGIILFIFFPLFFFETTRTGRKATDHIPA